MKVTIGFGLTGQNHSGFEVRADSDVYGTPIALSIDNAGSDSVTMLTLRDARNLISALQQAILTVEGTDDEVLR